MKIIFLDIDGVLNNAATTDRCGERVGIDKYCLSRLKNVIDHTKAKIVLISPCGKGWVKDAQLKNTQDEFANYIDEQFGAAGLTIYNKVGYESLDETIPVRNSILEYVERVQPEKYVIIDNKRSDYYDCNMKRHHVGIAAERGLLEHNTGRVLSLLLDEKDLF